MSTPIVRVLLVQPAGRTDTEGHLAQVRPKLVIERVTGVPDAITHMMANRYDCAVLDLDVVAVPDDLSAIRAAAPSVAVVLLSDASQEQATLDALARGVEDHLTRDHVDPVLAGRAVRFAVARKRAEAARVRVALQDPLTGLPNRLAVEEHLFEALRRAERRGTRIALIFVDLEGLSAIADIDGRLIADEALVGVGERLREVARESDAVGRLDADTFVVVCEDLALEVSVRHLADRIEEVLTEPISAGGRRMRLRPVFTFASGGPTQTPAQLLRRSTVGSIDLAFGR